MFKVGDWAVATPNSTPRIGKIKKIIKAWTDQSYLRFENGDSYFLHLCKPWSPQVGEWCWWWNDFDIPVKPELLKGYKRVSDGKIVASCLEYGRCKDFTHCEPFTNKLPSCLKEYE